MNRVQKSEKRRIRYVNAGTPKNEFEQATGDLRRIAGAMRDVGLTVQAARILGCCDRLWAVRPGAFKVTKP